MKHNLITTIILFFIPIWLLCNNAFYIYRNDDEFNVFFFENVDSMKCSRFDAENVLHEYFVTQEIYTPDSIYRIPLSSIDSIGFVTPKTIYKNDVKFLSDIMNYILNHNVLTFTVSNECPPSLVPKINDKVVTLDYNEIFPTGFAAKVTNISRQKDFTQIECEAIDLTEIFECFYGLSSDLPTNKSSRVQQTNKATMDGTFDKIFDLTESRLINLNTFPGLTYEENLSCQFSPELSLSIHPIFKAQGYVIVTSNLGTQIGGTVVGQFDLKENLGFSGSISWTEQFKKVFEFPVMSIAPLVNINLYIEPGAFIRTSALGGLSIEASQQYISAFNFQFNDRMTENPLKIVSPNVRQSAHSFKGDIFLNGHCDFGVYIDFGVNLIHTNLTSVAAHNELGLRFSGNNALFKTDFSSENTTNSNLYNRLLETKYQLGWFASQSIDVKLWPFQVNLPPIFNSYNPLAEISHVPIFSNGTCSYSNGILTTSIDVNGDVINPVDIGFVFMDKNYKELGRVWADLKYDGSAQEITSKSSIPNGSMARYVFPLVNSLSTEMIASPSFPVKHGKSLSGRWKPISSSDGSVESHYWLTFYREGVYIGSDYVDGGINEEGNYTYDGNVLSLSCEGNDDTNFYISFSGDMMSLTYIPDDISEETETTIYQQVADHSIVGVWEPFSASEYLSDYYRMIMYSDNTYKGVNIKTGKTEKWGEYHYGGGYLTLTYTSDNVSWHTDDAMVLFSPDGTRLYGRVGKDIWAIYQYVGAPPEK